MIAAESTFVHPYRRIYALFYHEATGVNRFYCWNCNIRTGQPIPLWVELSPLPGTPIDTGVSLAFHSIGVSLQNLIFAIKGKNNREFWVYDVGTNRWTRLEDLPVTPTKRVSLEAGGYTFWNDYPCVSIYFLHSDVGRFWRYHYPYTPVVQAPITWWQELQRLPIQSQSWTQMAYNPPRNSMYAIIQTLTGETSLYEYYIPTNTWFSRRALSATSGGGLQLASLGVVGTDYFPPHTVDTLYYFRGNNTRSFYHYLCNNNDWSTSPDDPQLRVSEGSGLAYGSLRWDYWLGKGMWAFFGNNTDTFGFFYPYTSAEGGGQSFAQALENPPCKIFHNREAKYLKFHLSNSSYYLEIYDGLGKLIHRTLVKEETKWDYRNFPSGVYFYHLKSPRYFSHTGKIVIHK